MKIDGTYPGSLIAFPDRKTMGLYAYVRLNEDGRVIQQVSATGWSVGPAIVIASIDTSREYTHYLYVITADAIGWHHTNRAEKYCEYVMSAPSEV